MIRFWSLLVYLGFRVLGLIGFVSPRVKHHLEVQKEMMPQLGDIRAKRSLSQQGALFFVSSAGEYEQVKPVIRRIREGSPEVYIYILFFSPSGVRFARSRKETLDYGMCPADLTWVWEEFFQALNPQMVFVNRYELWPGFLHVASRASKLYLINANRPNREGFWGNLFKRFVAGYFDRIFVVSKEGEEFFSNTLKVPSEKLDLVGDTKFDRVCERVEDVRRTPKASVQEISRLWGQGPRSCVLLGSVWPKDIDVFWGGFANLPKEHQDRLYVIAAPHEPSKEHVEEIESRASELGLTHVRLSQILKTPTLGLIPRVVVVDTIGHLFDLYSLGDGALIGGGMHYQVHNVLEPLGYGLSVAFGPFHKNSAEAVTLLQKGLAREINRPEDVTRWLCQVLQEPRVTGVGPRAAFVQECCGASDRIYREVSHSI